MKLPAALLCLLTAGCGWTTPKPKIEGYYWASSPFGSELYSESSGEQVASLIATIPGPAQVCIFNKPIHRCRYFHSDAQALAFIAEQESK